MASTLVLYPSIMKVYPCRLWLGTLTTNTILVGNHWPADIWWYTLQATTKFLHFKARISYTCIQYSVSIDHLIYAAAGKTQDFKHQLGKLFTIELLC